MTRFANPGLLVAFVAQLAVSACSGGGVGGVDTGTGGRPPGQASGSLAGIWDVIGTDKSGITSHAIFELSETVAELKYGSQYARVAHAADVSFAVAHRGFDTVSTKIVRGASPGLNQGALPFDITGSWLATNDEGADCGCAAILGARLDAACGQVNAPATIYPSWMPSADGQQLQAVHLDFRNSLFGDLGGRWHTEASDTPCELILEGSTLSGACGVAPERTSFLVQIGEGLVSGSTSAGIEFTAKRR
ncbi:MAG TPA: hypothetical protein PKA88_00105 [Polyangiaceae bacterium]|nr:hypothetical protein [Polyangiaceae bacterium]HMR77563.1 hypothetical protein [Polyangiaceae bacterium]